MVECTFKVIIQKCIDYKTCRKLSHNLIKLESESIEILRITYPSLNSKLPVSWINDTVLEKDHPRRRYFKSGLWNKERATEAVERAKKIYEIILNLILDGKISSEEL
ncbi:MAG: DNA-binding protein [Okeania sp. SIO2C9]|uniref:hypothetical protein n=1 Tax=Okeania sp. SIO2C9 TaxID=2607791 RepID=UPI0013BEB5E0|nr:hypothetical protein [Okeania sp. SIO2C9]NEQ74037.1 DNA-binding protein [Okeania sp. SIO2C9]